MLKIAWKDQTIGRSLSLSRTVTLWRWCSKGVKMGQQAIVGSIQGNVNRTLLKSHTKNLKEHIFKLWNYGVVGEDNTQYWCNLIKKWRFQKKKKAVQVDKWNFSLNMTLLSNMHPKRRKDKRDIRWQTKGKEKKKKILIEIVIIFLWLFHLSCSNCHNISWKSLHVSQLERMGAS